MYGKILTFTHPIIDTMNSIVRKSQRGIRDYHISLLFENGSIERVPGGMKKMVMTRKDIQAAISKRKQDIQVLSNLSGLTAIVDGETILTV